MLLRPQSNHHPELHPCALASINSSQPGPSKKRRVAQRYNCAFWSLTAIKSKGTKCRLAPMSAMVGSEAPPYAPFAFIRVHSRLNVQFHIFADPGWSGRETSLTAIKSKGTKCRLVPMSAMVGSAGRPVLHSRFKAAESHRVDREAFQLGFGG